MSVLQKLTEGIVQRDVSREGEAILNKWNKTGLLEGLESDRVRQNMAVLLENQAKELLREASSMAAGDVEGFAAVAFPIVRRVFGGLIANDLVSVQPMSLPSGLIFFLDFTKADAGRQGGVDESIYGGGVVGQQLTGGVNLSGRNDQSGFYSLSTGYSSATGSLTVDCDPGDAGVSVDHYQDGAARSEIDFDADLKGRAVSIVSITSAVAGTQTTVSSPHALDEFDVGIPQGLEPSAASAAENGGILGAAVSKKTGDICVVLKGSDALCNDWNALAGNTNNDLILRVRLVRRHTRLHENTSDGLRSLKGVSQLALEPIALVDSEDQDITNAEITNASYDVDAAMDGKPQLAFSTAQAVALMTAATADASAFGVTLSGPIKDDIKSGIGLGALVGTDQWGLEEPGPGTGKRGQGDDSTKNVIPEIDIKVDSVAVTAQTKKLKAKWTPELAQDLNAYHNLDAEVELTGILSEQIALEIDQEILGDLIRGASGGTLHWSRHPGKFLNRETGADLTNDGLSGPDFTGTVSEWYETLIETINDVSAQIHRKTLRGGANFVVVSPEMANILEFTSGFRAKATHDQEKGQVGAVNVGSLSKKFDVYVDPYFLRNVILVGRKGGSFLESGFVYAPYVPLQTTPTIFGTEDFVPRKGVMTRYAKKMVRPDMYGLVVVQDLLG